MPGLLGRIGDGIEAILFGRWEPWYRRFVRAVVGLTALVVAVDVAWIVGARLGYVSLSAGTAGALRAVSAAVLTLFLLTGGVQLLVMARVLDRSTEEVVETADELERSAERVADAAETVDDISETIADADEAAVDTPEDVEAAADEARRKTEDAKETAEEVAERLAEERERLPEDGDETG